MGQMTLGLLYGSKEPVLPTTEDEYADSKLYELIDRFHEAVGGIRSPHQPCVDVEYEGGEALVGIWIALGGSGLPGVAFFVDAAVPLADLADFYAEELTSAQTLWAQFVRYCAEQEHISLPSAQLWITPTEVA